MQLETRNGFRFESTDQTKSDAYQMRKPVSFVIKASNYEHLMVLILPQLTPLYF